MIALTLGEVRMTDVAREPVIILRESEGDRILPIWVSAAAAHAVLAATDPPAPTPGTHDLVLEILATFGKSVDAVRILSVDEGVFSAVILIGNVAVDARVSDAVALALRSGAQILASEEVMAAASLREETSRVGESQLEADDQVQRFRDFLDSINPDDFDGAGGQP